MHEFKHGELKTARGARKVKNRKQAIAIALHEAGASNQERSQTNARNLRLTKSKERRRETYQDGTEGHRSTQRTYARATDASGAARIPAVRRAPTFTPRPHATTSVAVQR